MNNELRLFQLQNNINLMLKDVDHAFSDIKRSNNIPSAINTIKRVFHKLEVSIKEIRIVKADKEEFFGMCVFPDKATADALVKAMMNNKPLEMYQKIWEDCKNWTIEIDSKIIYDRKLNASPAELTAAILHEIGHVVYSNSIPQKLHKTMSMSYVQLPFKIKELIKKTKNNFYKVYLPVVAQASMNTSYSLKKELEADKYVAKMGYGEHLEHLLQKIITCYGSRYTECDKKAQEENLRVACNWSADQLQELELRQDRLRSSLNVMVLTSPSVYIKDLFNDIDHSIFKGVPSIDELVARNSNPNTIVKESVYIDLSKPYNFNLIMENAKKEKKTKHNKYYKITQQDIDIVAIQVDQIKYQDDKIYLLDVIYDYITTLDLMEEAILNGEKDKVPLTMKQIDTYRAELQDLRMRVLQYRIAEKRYGVFVKYPVGYEG